MKPIAASKHRNLRKADTWRENSEARRRSPVAAVLVVGDSPQLPEVSSSMICTRQLLMRSTDTAMVPPVLARF